MTKTILIIEDNEDIREGTAEILELAGYNTLKAKNGKEGVDLVVQKMPDLILCDIMMPVLDGYGVLYLLSKNQKTTHIPFIFITAKAERADMRKGMEMGADDYLTKPFDDIELLNAIESRLNKKVNALQHHNQGVNPEVLINELLNKGRVKNYDAKQLIYITDDEPNFLYYIKKGKIKSYLRFTDGRDLASSLFSAGDFFGYEALLTEKQFKDNAVALEDTELCLIPKQEFLDILFHYPDVSKSFIRLLSTNLIDKGGQLLKLAYFSVRKRVADALIDVAQKFNTDETDTYTLKLSRDDLASLVGTANETVSRTLADFKDEGLIEKKGNLIIIKSLEKLKKVKQ